MGSLHSTQRQDAKSRARKFDSQAQRSVVNSDIGRTRSAIHKTEMDVEFSILELRCPLRKNVSPTANISQNLHRKEALRQAGDFMAVKDNTRHSKRQHPTPNIPASDDRCARSTMEKFTYGKIAIKHRLSDASDTEPPRKKTEAQFPREESSHEARKYEYIIEPFKPQHTAQFEGGNTWKEVHFPGHSPSGRSVNPAAVQPPQTQSKKRPRCTSCASH